MAAFLRQAGVLSRGHTIQTAIHHCGPALRRNVLKTNSLWSSNSVGNRLNQFGCFKPISGCFASNLRTNVAQIFKRNFSKSKTFGKKRLPFEVDTNIAKDITVFSYTDDRFYFLLSCFGIVQLIFWGNLASFSYSTLTTFSGKDSERYFDKDSTWAKFLGTLGNHKGRIASVCIIIGLLIGSLTLIYPSRSIHKMVFLRGGRELKITTYGLFGRKNTLNIPLESISCKQTWHSPTPTLALQVKGKWFNYMMFKKDGRLHEQALFDYAIGLDRF